LPTRPAVRLAAAPKNMVRIPRGTFVMGSDNFYAEERPAREVTVGGFLMDEHPVTNAEFRRFVKDTGYQTIAEQRPDPADFPDAEPADLMPGSLVFRSTPGPVPLDDWRRWWHWTPGASWRTPTGPGSTLHGLDRHPVVHVSYEDGLAYAEWSGKQLADEAEWEYAARAGRPPTTYAWGEQFMPKGKVMANTWHGSFPWENADPHGIERTSPVGRYPSNGWGLVDLIGNVWEWTCSPWTQDHAQPANSHVDHGCCAPDVTADGALREEDRRVMKGGSHLCAPSYCLRYRPPARQGQQVRSSASHLGFRCVIRE
jgi:formylglycine-generating enzyme